MAGSFQGCDREKFPPFPARRHEATGRPLFMTCFADPETRREHEPRNRVCPSGSLVPSREVPRSDRSLTSCHGQEFWRKLPPTYLISKMRGKMCRTTLIFQPTNDRPMGSIKVPVIPFHRRCGWVFARRDGASAGGA